MFQLWSGNLSSYLRYWINTPTFWTSNPSANKCCFLFRLKSYTKNLSTNSNRDIQNLAQVIDKLLASYDIQIILQWVPGHTDIRGNDHADRLAKLGASKEQPDKLCSYNTIRQILRNNFKEIWYNRWAMGNTGRAMYKEMDKPKLQDPINQLSRPDQSPFFSLKPGIQC